MNPACVATCPSGPIYKRAEDGIVLISRTNAVAGVCASLIPYKKIYFNWKSGESEKCIFCYPRIDPVSRPFARKPVSGVSVILACCCMMPTRLNGRQREGEGIFTTSAGVFLDPHNPEVIGQRPKTGIR
ncbi:4Fe-4S dicluster domain-containing protein [Escherichia coli]